MAGKSKYGVTRIKDPADGQWKPLRGLYLKTEDGWQPVKTGWVKHKDDQWQRIYPSPTGAITLSSSTITFDVYRRYDSTTQKITITNTGDDELVIDEIYIVNGSNFTTTLSLRGMNGGTPVALKVGESKYFELYVHGADTTGVSIGSIIFTQDSSILGSSNVAFPIVTTVKDNYAAIKAYSNGNIEYYVGEEPESTTITIVNTGNGATLNILDISSQNGSTIINPPTEVGFDWNTYTGKSATFTVKPPGDLDVGSYTDVITITSDAGVATVPINAKVLVSHGNNSWTSPGTYTWTVPRGVYSINITAIGGGGGGGGSTEVGNGGAGGGGGSGGIESGTLAVTPGEVLTIVVGAGGAGSPYVGRDAGASGAGGVAGTGGTSRVTGVHGTVGAAGGAGGESGTMPTYYVDYGGGYYGDGGGQSDSGTGSGSGDSGDGDGD